MLLGHFEVHWDAAPMYVWALVFFILWILVGTLSFAAINNWTYIQSFYYNIQMGFAVGFGAAPEHTLGVGHQLFGICLLVVSFCAISLILTYFSDIMTERYQKYLRATDMAFAMSDEDKDGQLDLDEFHGMLMQSSKPKLRNMERAQVERLFHEIDRHVSADQNSGYISIEEFQKYSKGMASITCCEKFKYYVEQYYFYTWCLLLFVGGGIMFGYLAKTYDHLTPGQRFVTGLYFAIGGAATGGFLAPDWEDSSHLAWSGIFILLAVPTYGILLGKLAGKFAEHKFQGRMATEKQSQEEMGATDYIKFLDVLDDGKVTVNEYILIELLRAGVVRMSQINVLRGKFKEIDTDNSGFFTIDDLPAIAALANNANAWMDIGEIGGIDASGSDVISL